MSLLKKNGGFTLVELIVVIAILAILAGVAVPAYSGYVEKANQQADITLVREVKNALELAMYGDPFKAEPTGKLVLSKNGISGVTAGGEVEAALVKVFGADYAETIKLKYDGWAVASHINGMVAANATAVQNSSYLSGGRSENLLKDVEKFTSMAANLAEAMGSTSSGSTLASLFGNTLLDDTAAKYGIEVDSEYKKDGVVDWDAWGQDNQQEFSNMLVLATALDTQKAMDPEANHVASEATNLVTTFSNYYAFAATCPEFSGVLDQYMDAMNAKEPTVITRPDGTTVTVNPVTTPSSGASWYSQLQNEMKNGYKNTNGLTYDAYTANDENGDSAAYSDQFAFNLIMSALGNASAEDVAGDIGNANLFTDGAVKGMYDQYLDAVEVMSGMSDQMASLSASAGEIAIVYNQATYTVMDTAKQ